MKIPNVKTGGLTLVETVVYVAILVVILVGLVTTLIFISNSLLELKASRDIKSSAMISLERITYEIRQAESINLGQSVLGVNPSKLVLDTKDGAGSPTTIEFYRENGVIKIKEGGTYAGDLTQSLATTTSFVVERITTAESEMAKIELTLENLQGAQAKAETFYASVVLRGSY